ncbi:MAG: UDP-4-amino-4,6-dideoxy-N-acetyl-beta-L-altrosamine transaminase [Oceanicaulis sp.]|uniref:UDP-4-amino-4, 6-dideoxy-N-acetyl-beta-L-altrosamine transaminase n=1 Tax=unclassified Oceanicaulis TaxID=2632123 RepID=UPI000C3EC869|nr:MULTISPECIES: UDP-4-amino-4,6-dideoxy-N-acetyl-beta-L-altrosamine transaminase [unclassified Oceanicaulis]MAB69814.1 UDP-4-amino-4,6-dideoxy-N-acetyl-beta-L-altrosamine transaminase [Oceanicaulis sp.]MBC39852.1 UDP-4-amino-4,6-dideoxy-N-acetyl-beta-L-altrosamine transaminase [Oceanicaulis sp.]MBG37050.1 UDP-4-amino-4,6-dideoxy-N-acetyl-beta-L-altrosamine transaminase [Oceanicaulis sp.]HCR94675.1 UDP-4-amino-4,6-dideoxy-N-acetyl-beta-L-altrosamine transaminase [Oceanicaulis sp.]|tara:strand:+ start:2382 stop:3557 length:1176 start_codon:yes stop_codon:yes gene_type:complete
MSDGFLPYGRQWIDDADIEAVTTCLKSDYLTTGPAVSAFERAFATVVQAPHAVSCHSATAGLHLAYDALGLGPGQCAIVPAITFVATANAARYCGADVIVCDVDPDNGLMTPDTLSEALQQLVGRPGLVAPVHLAGVPCDMPALAELARAHGLSVVEDASHAVGSLDEAGSPTGACPHSDAAVFSFHPVKTLACGEGGMVTTRDAALAERMALTRSHGVVREADRFERSAGADEPWWYEMQALGWNYRMPDINAALGLSQLNKLELFASRRRQLARAYDDLLEGQGSLLAPSAGRAGVDPCRHLYNIRIDFQALGKPRAQVMTELREQGIGTQVHYIPVHQHPYYVRLNGERTLPGAEHHYARTLSLPLYPMMADEDPERVVSALKVVLGL